MKGWKFKCNNCKEKSMKSRVVVHENYVVRLYYCTKCGYSKRIEIRI